MPGLYHQSFSQDLPDSTTSQEPRAHSIIPPQGAVVRLLLPVPHTQINFSVRLLLFLPRPDKFDKVNH